MPDARGHRARLVFQRPRLRFVERAESLASVDLTHEEAGVVVFNLVARADDQGALVVYQMVSHKIVEQVGRAKRRNGSVWFQ